MSIKHTYSFGHASYHDIICYQEEELMSEGVPSSVRAVEERAEKTHSSILYLTLESLGRFKYSITW